MKSLQLSVVLVCLLVCVHSNAEDAKPELISYSDQIEPIFRSRCQGCHQPAKPLGEFVMTDVAAMFQSGESGEPGIVPGQPDASYLVSQIASIDGMAEMPKKGPALNESEVQLIKDWIAQGAKDDSVAKQKSFDKSNPPSYTSLPVVTALATSPDGKWLASSGFHEILLLDAKTLQLKTRLIGLSPRIESLAFSSDSKLLAATGGHPWRFGEVQIWDVNSEELVTSKQLGFDTIYGGAFSPDDSLFSFGGTDNVVRAIDVRTGEQKLQQGAHEDWVLASVFTPDSQHLLSAGRDMTVKLTEVKTQRFVDNVTSITPGALRGGINGLAMHPARNEFLVGGADGVPKIYRVFRETERRIGDDANLIRRFPALPGRTFAVGINHKGDQFVSTSVLNGTSHVRLYPYTFDGALPANVKAAMAKRVAGRSAAEKKLISDWLSDIPSPVFEKKVEGSSVYAVAFSGDDRSLFVGGSDGIIREYDAANGEELSRASPVDLSNGEGVESRGVATKLADGLPNLRLQGYDAEAERSLLPDAELVGLDVSPTKLSFTKPDSYVQLVVTGKFANGSSVDVTRHVQFDAPSFIQVGDKGIVRTAGSGKGTMRVSLLGKQGELPISCGLETRKEAIDFTHDVNPILSKLGCNSGTCHGAQKGKNGFKLSLRGYDPLEDLRSLGDDLSARRLNTAVPDASLMLEKPTGIAPHEGGVLLTQDSTYYQTLKEWISQGAQYDPATKKVERIELIPAKPVIDREGALQQFRVVAHYPNGASKDVTLESFVESGNSEVCESLGDGLVKAIRRGEAPILARYEGAYAAATVTVMGERSGFRWQQPEAYSQIDELVASKWQRMKIQPSEVCSDEEFLRRVRLDLTGLPPTVLELKQFLADDTPSTLKRQQKIEELLSDGDYVEHWTNKWADLLQVNSKFIGREGAQAFRGWIREAVETNRPYDEFAKQILTASGSNKDVPAASYFKILREPDLMMENTTHLFLAIRFNCNKCHDHPFERWTQDQYYELAAYFAQTELKSDPASGKRRIGGSAVEGAKPLYEIVSDAKQGEIQHERTGQDVAPSFPYDCDFEVKEDATRREKLAAWITSPDNPYFAKSYVNRLWGYLTGTGLMEPIDDIRAGNPPTNPELLEHLTREFVESGFNTKHVLRLICNSRTYQLSVKSNRWNEDDAINYSHAKARRLPAEVLYDSVYAVTGAVSKIPGVKPGTRAAALPDVAVQLPDGFLNNLGRPVRESACECERSQDLQLGPVMALVSGPTIGQAISDPQCDLSTLAGQELGNEELITEVYLRILSRYPSGDEVKLVLDAADQIELDHEQLNQQLQQREMWWKSEREKIEAKRLAAVAKTTKEIANRVAAIKAERARMEAERASKIQQATAALEKYAEESRSLAKRYLKGQPNLTEWHPVLPISLTSTAPATFTVGEDRSVFVNANDAKIGKTEYRFRIRTSLSKIQGLRLEALPDSRHEGGGPGFPTNGNFVLTELELLKLEKDGKSKKIALKNAKADFSQDGFAPAQAIDGNSRDQRGWAVHPRGGVVHWMTAETSEQVNSAGELCEFEIVLHQHHNAEHHRLSHFRVSLTSSTEIQLGLPEVFAAMSLQELEKVKSSQLKPLVDYLQISDPIWLKLKSGLAAAERPLPEDAEVVRLKAKLAQLEKPTPDEPGVVQLRSDFAASSKQMQNKRLTLVQDLTWALINSPAFLFNH